MPNGTNFFAGLQRTTVPVIVEALLRRGAEKRRAKLLEKELEEQAKQSELDRFVQLLRQKDGLTEDERNQILKQLGITPSPTPEQLLQQTEKEMSPERIEELRQEVERKRIAKILEPFKLSDEAVARLILEGGLQIPGLDIGISPAQQALARQRQTAAEVNIERAKLQKDIQDYYRKRTELLGNTKVSGKSPKSEIDIAVDSQRQIVSALANIINNNAFSDIDPVTAEEIMNDFRNSLTRLNELIRLQNEKIEKSTSGKVRTPEEIKRSELLKAIDALNKSLGQ